MKASSKSKSDPAGPSAGSAPPIAFLVANELGIIDQLMNAVGERCMAQAGLNLAQFGVLNNFVRLGGERTPVQLARAFQVTKGAMTNTLQRLHALAMVQIVDHPQDGRSKIVTITPKGRKAHGEAVAALAPDLARLTAGVGQTTLERLLPELQKLRIWLDENR